MNEDTVDLGPCCACEKHDGTVRNIVALPWKVPVEFRGKGWGCLVCGLEPNGATAVVCDSCAQGHRNVVGWSWIKFVCAGYAKEGRIPFSSLDFNESNGMIHDMQKHAADEARIRFAS